MKKNVLYAFPFLLTALLLVAAIPYMAPQSAQGLEVGDTAMGFKLKNVDGRMVSLDDFPKAKGFIVTFTCNHCPYAKLYEQRIMDLDKQYAGKGYPVIAINPNDATDYPEDSFEKMQARAGEKQYTFPYLVDETQEIAQAYGATKTPHIYVLQREHGTLKVKYIGAIDNAPQEAAKATEFYVKDAIDALLAGKEVPKTVTKAVGCSIKWKS